MPWHEARPPAPRQRHPGARPGAYVRGPEGVVHRLPYSRGDCWVHPLSADAAYMHLEPDALHVRRCCMTVQIREAVEVLDKLNPLQHVATVRKSQVQHALADMLTLMLAHSVAVDEPRWAMWSSLVHG